MVLAMFYLCFTYVLAMFYLCFSYIFWGPLLFWSLRGLRSFRSQEGRRTAEGLQNIVFVVDGPLAVSRFSLEVG